VTFFVRNGGISSKRVLLRFAVIVVVLGLLQLSWLSASDGASKRRASRATKTKTATKTSVATTVLPVASSVTLAPVASTTTVSETGTCDARFDVNDNGRPDCISVKLVLPSQISRQFDVRIDLTLDGGMKVLSTQGAVVTAPNVDRNSSLSLEPSAVDAKDWLKVWGVSGKTSKILWISAKNRLSLLPFETHAFYPVQILKDSIHFVTQTNDGGQTVPAEVSWEQSVSKTDLWFGCDGDDGVATYVKVRLLDGIGTQATHFQIVNGAMKFIRTDEPILVRVVGSKQTLRFGAARSASRSVSTRCR
jgi:hypothetical protein